jgi:ATP-dependent helicase/nuclease subunit A
LKESKDPEILKKDLGTYQNWRTRWDTVRQLASLATVNFRTAKDQARIESAPGQLEPEVQVIEVSRHVERPAGMRFGALVHAALAAVPLGANDVQVSEITSLHARILGNDEREAVAAVTAVQSVLAHPFMTRAREAVLRGQCRRETPVTFTLANGMLVEGVLDLAFLENDEWTVVDFKTDRELEKDLERYKRQVGLYALSISRATGQACTGRLMKI